jgi:hypothetical protein
MLEDVYFGRGGDGKVTLREVLRTQVVRMGDG